MLYSFDILDKFIFETSEVNVRLQLLEISHIECSRFSVALTSIAVAIFRVNES
jgi:hypothetical protein